MRIEKLLPQKIDYFSEGKELACNCCGKIKLSQDFYERLNVARVIAGIPFVSNSSCRCEAHNIEVGGVKGSSHEINEFKECTAIDIKCTDDSKRWIIIDALIKAGFNRIGISKTFIHADRDPTKNKNRIWVY